MKPFKSYGIVFITSNNFTIEACNFTNNEVTRGGAIYLE